jgi:hypothetical protein
VRKGSVLQIFSIRALRPDVLHVDGDDLEW